MRSEVQIFPGPPILTRAVEIGAIAQLGERLLCKQEVVGSIPSGSTTSPNGEAACELLVRMRFARCKSHYKEEIISSRRLVEIWRDTSLNDIVNRASHLNVCA